MAKTITMTFKQEKETKNTFRYEEETDDEKPHAFYLKKGPAEELGNPNEIEIEVRAK